MYIPDILTQIKRSSGWLFVVIFSLIPVALWLSQNPIQAGEIEPGEVISGDVSFLIDKSSYDGSIFFDARWENSKPIYISID